MLEALKSKAAQESRIITIVGPGTAVEGRLVSTGPIRVEGRVVGQLQSEEQIMVLASGRVKADIEARHVVISGEVEGDVTASERMEITRGAKLIGNISAPRISIDEGVLFEGRCTMYSPEERAVFQANDVAPKAQQVTGATATTPPGKHPSAVARNTPVSRDPATKTMEAQLNLDEAADLNRKTAAPSIQRPDTNTATINNVKQNRAPGTNSNSPQAGQKSAKQNRPGQSSAPADNEKAE